MVLLSDLLLREQVPHHIMPPPLSPVCTPLMHIFRIRVRLPLRVPLALLFDFEAFV